MEGFQERREVSAFGVEGQLGVGAGDGPLQLCDAVGGRAGGVADGGVFPVVAELLGGELGLSVAELDSLERSGVV